MSWRFLTNHARALLRIARDPGVRFRDIAASTGITDRGAYGILTDLTAAGYVVKQKDGRRNRYQIEAHLPLPEPASQEPRHRRVLALLAGAGARLQLTGPDQPEATAPERACAPGRRPAPGSPARLIGRRSAMDPDTGVLPGLGLSSNEPRRPCHRRSEGRIRHRIRPCPASNSPGLLPPAASRLVTDLSRMRCRDASGLAVLTGTGRPPGCPAYHAWPRPGGQALAHHPARAGGLTSSPTVQAAVTGLAGGQHRPSGGAGAAGTGFARTGQTWAAGGYVGHAQHAADACGFRQAIATCSRRRVRQAAQRPAAQVAAAGRAGLPTALR